jgi:hypothetical protein
MASVFIPQLPTRFDKATGIRIPSIDVNPASRFGELKQLFGLTVPRDEALAGIRTSINQIGPEDYILAVGDVVLLAMTVAYALISNGRTTLLRWDNDLKAYKTEEVRL